MAITVQPTPSTTGEEAEPRHVPSGEDFTVEDGALVVLDGTGGQRVAIFAPGTWVEAQVDD